VLQESCCNVLNCVAVCCNVLRCDVWCAVAVWVQQWVLQRVAMCCGVNCGVLWSVISKGSKSRTLQRVAVCCSVLQCSVERDIKNQREYRVAKTHRMPHLNRSFSAKEPYNWWLCGGKRTAI